ncbi:MAG: helix-turn-helix domain-containing protein [Candidatus Eremiobacteraeota bacterium]|nr:helix-turn-helix domain-containing protein [Candidatus Eremiobacteraeota bacterium]
MKRQGEQIRKARKEMGLTQKELARLLEVHWNTVARWERNEIECRIDQMHKIAKITKKPITWFFAKDPVCEDKVFVNVDSNKFRIAREKNNYSINEIAVLLELPEKVVREIEEKNAPVEMEYLHRMVFVLGYPYLWFLATESDDKYCDSDAIQNRWLETGKEPWKFKEQYYNLWEQKLVLPKIGADDMKKFSMALSNFSSAVQKSLPSLENAAKQIKKEVENFDSIAKIISESTQRQVNFFLKMRREREKQIKEQVKIIKEFQEIANKTISQDIVSKAINQDIEDEDVNKDGND